MSKDRHVVVVGASDEDTAHLRLLIRKAGDKLMHRWRWGSESAADLVVVDAGAFAGQMARTRAISGGKRCATFLDAGVEADVGTDLVLRRPLKVDNVIEVLDIAGGDVVEKPSIAPQRDDFYFDDLNDSANPRPAIPDIEPAPNLRPNADVPPGLDEVLKVDPADNMPNRRVPGTLGEKTTVDSVSEATKRSEQRRREAPDAYRSSVDVNLQPPPRKSAIDHSRHPLRDYLGAELLGGPSQLGLTNMPTLTLDPKLRVFHADAGLSALEPYCREPIARSSWMTLTTGELTSVRDAFPPQPYERLLWLYVLVNSGGRLAPHLDPGGTFKLTRWLQIERDYTRYFRIASAMLQPARLNEIAAASGATMDQVFDAVNAYDAVGLIEWQRRQPRHGDPTDKPSLFDRLRRPFGK